LGFDAAVEFQPDWGSVPFRGAATLPERIAGRLRPRSRVGPGAPDIVDYNTMVEAMLAKPEPPYRRFPAVTPGFDNTPRRPEGGFVLENPSPEAYERWLTEVLRRRQRESTDTDLVFVNAWNEWAEGNHLEPSQRWGRAFLEAHRRAMSRGRAEADRLP
jgi:hypothetical protein